MPPNHHAQLPLELWTETFRVLDRRNWMQLRCVCRDFNSIVSQLLFSSIRIFFFDEDHCFRLLPTTINSARERHQHFEHAERLVVRSWEMLDHITRDPKFAAVVRVMNVYAFCASFSVFDNLCLANALRKLPYLRTFRWLAKELEIPPIIVESITANLSSFVSFSKPSCEAPFTHLQHLCEIAFYIDPMQHENDSMQEVLMLNTQSLRKLTLPSHLYDTVPPHLLDNLTHLDLGCDPDHTRGSSAILLCHLPRLESLSLQSNSRRCETELIKSLPQDANVLPNLISLRLRLDCETNPSSGRTYNLLSFIRNRRKLKRLYLENEGLNDPANYQILFSLLRELPELHVLGLNPCHILLSETDTAQTAMYRLLDVLPQDLKALHIGLPAAENALFDYDSSFVNELGRFQRLTYINVIDDDFLLLFVPSEVAFDNPRLQFIGHNGRICDVQHSLNAINVVERPYWMFEFATPEDFVDDDHLWLYQCYTASEL